MKFKGFLIALILAVGASSAFANENAKLRTIASTTGDDCSVSCTKVQLRANQFVITTYDSAGEIQGMDVFTRSELKKGAPDTNTGGIELLYTPNTTVENDDGTTTETTYFAYTLGGIQYIYRTITIRDANGNIIGQETELLVRNDKQFIR